ncbi:hypothetical protein CR164_04380 [Prosthecochloris marina]|uniref:Uncharacterized protein n=1 Tax=Prosthecochloris marina TaxID=2017681 RepID=A0A317T6N7_9CHLB|nr:MULTISPECIES: hypothetical protein [Prosthecochloris]PWW82255.1 hypothetical protein CR164_04380 [Prosthecochloris marina]
MEKKAEPLKNIEARIHELENSIHERERQLKERAGQFKKELQAELSPTELIRKYPLQTTGASLLFGFFSGKIIRAIVSHPSHASAEPAAQSKNEPSELKSAVASIGIDVLRSSKDLAFSYLKHYLDSKMKPGKDT